MKKRLLEKWEQIDWKDVICRLYNGEKKASIAASYSVSSGVFCTYIHLAKKHGYKIPTPSMVRYFQNKKLEEEFEGEQKIEMKDEYAEALRMMGHNSTAFIQDYNGNEARKRRGCA